jgi:hypothetical protein
MIDTTKLSMDAILSLSPPLEYKGNRLCLEELSSNPKLTVKVVYKYRYGIYGQNWPLDKLSKLPNFQSSEAVNLLKLIEKYHYSICDILNNPQVKKFNEEERRQYILMYLWETRKSYREPCNFVYFNPITVHPSRIPGANFYTKN